MCCFFFHYVSAKFTSGLLQVILPRPRIVMLSLVTVSPVWGNSWVIVGFLWWLFLILICVLLTLYDLYVKLYMSYNVNTTQITIKNNQIMWPTISFILEMILFTLWIYLHWTPYQEYLNICNWNNSFVLAELFPTPDLLDWRIPIYHHHHVMLLAWISLTLSCHFSLSFITSGRSSGLHPVSLHSCSMYVLAGHPALARPYVGVHRGISLMSSSLLLQQCPACLVYIFLIRRS